MNQVPRAEQELLAGAERRVGRLILGLIAPGALAAGWQWGGAMAAAFAVGGALAYLNYRWIVAVVDTLMKSQQAHVPRRAYAKIFLPLVLLGVALYVIVARSWVSVAGVFAGLSLLVVGVLVELLYQIMLAVRH
jgi:hypothetical protein